METKDVIFNLKNKINFLDHYHHWEKKKLKEEE